MNRSVETPASLTIKSARESARTGQRDAATARRAALKRRRGPLFASSAADSAGSVRAVKEARVLGKGAGSANVMRVLATQVVWGAAVAISDNGGSATAMTTETAGMWAHRHQGVLGYSEAPGYASLM